MQRWFSGKPLLEDPQLLGRFGESTAARFLHTTGALLLEMNWKTSFGELDIVATRSRCLLIVEVKTRSDSGGYDPLLALTPDKKTRLRKLARLFIFDHRTTLKQMRITRVRLDLIALVVSSDLSYTLEHQAGTAEELPQFLD